jgi:ribosomal protein S19
LFDETVGRRCGVSIKETELGPSFGDFATTPENEVYDDDETKAVLLPR